DDGIGLANESEYAAPETMKKSGGSGQGLALHGTMMAVIGGALWKESEPGKYTRISLSLPLEATP
ncbi:MAG TPA: ATP-binding protein, partial [Abditibacteriaceae bacterium]